MCSERTAVCMFVAVIAFCAASCGRRTVLTGIRTGEVGAEISIPSDHDFEKAKKELSENVRVDDPEGDGGDSPIIMNAIRDEATGEMVATDVISASTVVARFRNVAERFGKVVIEFDINVPSSMMRSEWKLRFTPLMKILGDSIPLLPIDITGRKYRDEQMRGYRRYQAFLASIITDSTDFVRKKQLEVFLSRNFPRIYAMKNDSSFIADPDAESFFGISQREALIHYTKHYLKERNDRRIGNTGKMFRKFVKDPLGTETLRLDTVLTGVDGNMIYRYVQEVRSRPGLRRIDVSLSGELYMAGKSLCKVGTSDDLTFYVSSLSTLADLTPRYRMKIVERKVYDKTHAFIDFAPGSALIDTSLSCNASELRRIVKCIADVMSYSEYELDSLVVTASCSPEGRYSFNRRLSEERGKSVVAYMKDFLEVEQTGKLRTGSVPENWELLVRLSESDSLLSPGTKEMIARAAAAADKDMVEKEMSALPDYKYLREKLYPRLRTVLFDFHLHRKGMLKDTVHTKELDSVYLAGVEAIREMDYRKAVEILRPYHDYNTALAYLSAGYDHSALADLERIPTQSARVLYLKAIVLARLGRKEEAMLSYMQSVREEPSMAHRANLDPELSEFIHLGRFD